MYQSAKCKVSVYTIIYLIYMYITIFRDTATDNTEVYEANVSMESWPFWVQ